MRYKRLIFSLLLVTMCATATAQYENYYYHVTGDTINTTPDNGYFSWWDFDYFIQHNLQLRTWTFNTARHYGVRLQKFFTPTPLKVIGLAGVVVSVPPYTGWFFPSVQSSRQEYFYLYDYDQDSAGIEFKGRLAWSALDTHRTLMVYENYNLADAYGFDTCCYQSFSSRYYTLREYYFDTAIIVNDSFYVGGSSYSNWERETAEIAGSPLQNDTFSVTDYIFAMSTPMLVNHHRNCVDMPIPWDVDTTESFYHSPSYHDFGLCYFPVIPYLVCNDTGTWAHPEGNYAWQHDTALAAMLVYPIVQVDTTVPPTYLCDSVQNLEASVDSGGCLTVTWDDFMHYSYCEVEYYALQDGYGSRVQQTVYGSNILTVCGLDAAKQWYVRVRAYCDTSKQETSWTPWLAAGRDMPTAVGGPSDLARFTNVMPNPATGSVTVTSCFGMRSVEVYNMRGLLVYSDGTPWYTSKSIDLAGWVPGQYVVIIETPAGKTAKRMTVVR